MTSAREEQTPLGRLADPWEMVRAVDLHGRGASNFMTGASLIGRRRWTIQ